MRFWLLTCLCVASSHAAAGLFSDDDARKQVQQLEARVVKLEQALSSSEADKEQTIRSMLDLQMQLEAVNTELRKLHGQNEESAHNLQDAEKRQKDFYIDLDTRLRRIESPLLQPVADGRRHQGCIRRSVGRKPRVRGGLYPYRAENYQNAAAAFRNFLKNYPQSVHEANVLTGWATPISCRRIARTA